MPSSSSDNEERTMIVGLKLTITGEELRARLQQRAQEHRVRAECWKRERDKSPEERREDECMRSEDVCDNEAEQHDWRADVLEFIRDHVDPREAYQLSEADLVFGELLPEKPAWLEQQEWEEQRLGAAWPTHTAPAASTFEDSQS
jgi:hypothetical protein